MRNITGIMLKEIDYHSWKALELTSGKASVVIPQEIGPRIVACSLAGGANLFHNVKEELGGRDEKDWHLRGGHRLWHSPEKMPRSYDPDNFPILVRKNDNSSLVLEAPGPDHSGLHKVITIDALGDECFRLTHAIRNHNQWPVTFAPWALTVMERGGRAAIPLPPKGSHETDLLPGYSVVPWTYTDFSLPCWQFFRNFIGIDTAKASSAQKLGLTGYPGWSAYWQPGGTFIKYSPVAAGASYPDFGCVFEVFSCDFMIELETLAPLHTLEENEIATHVEHWKIVADLPEPDSDEAYDQGVRRVAESWVAGL